MFQLTFLARYICQFHCVNLHSRTPIIEIHLILLIISLHLWILIDGKDSLPLKIDTFVDRCSDVRVKRKAVQDGTFQHGKDQVFSEQVKGKSIIEALIPDQIFCQASSCIWYVYVFLNVNRKSSGNWVCTCDGIYYHLFRIILYYHLTCLKTRYFWFLASFWSSFT